MAVDEHNMEVGVLCITISQGSQRTQHIFLSAYIEIIYTYFSSLSVTGILLEKKIQNIYYVYEKKYQALNSAERIKKNYLI